MRLGISSTVIVLLATIALLFLPGRPALAGNTTVVISVSIGGGVAVGMVGWFIHLTYSQRVARTHPQPHTLSMQGKTQGEGLGLYESGPGGLTDDKVFLPTPGRWETDHSPPKQTAFIRFVDLRW